jgi:hypothetical protein
MTLAWGVVGAAAGLCAMYSTDVIDAGSWYASFYEPARGQWCEPEGQVLLFGRVVYRGHSPGEYAFRVVAAWLVGVAVFLAVLGASAAIVASRLLSPQFRSARRFDPGLALLACGGVFACLAAFGYPWLNEGGWRRQDIRDALQNAKLSSIIPYGKESLYFLALAIPVGWATQVVVASLGLRHFPSPDQPNVSDYGDDRVAAEPTRPPDRGG